jgi:uncharacterized membrane protein YkvI
MEHPTMKTSTSIGHIIALTLSVILWLMLANTTFSNTYGIITWSTGMGSIFGALTCKLLHDM